MDRINNSISVVESLICPEGHSFFPNSVSVSMIGGRYTSVVLQNPDGALRPLALNLTACRKAVFR